MTFNKFVFIGLAEYAVLKGRIMVNRILREIHCSLSESASVNVAFVVFEIRHYSYTFGGKGKTFRTCPCLGK